jgi:uncharacterized C2H2 Zn-finger protein
VAYKCEYCGQILRSSNNLTIHVYNKHTKVLPKREEAKPEKEKTEDA